MGTPDDVQRAAAELADLDNDQYIIRGAKQFFEALIADGWTPPGSPGQLQQAYDQGWSDGVASTTDDRKVLTTSPDAWVPVALRWRFIKAGDVFVGDGQLWTVTAVPWGNARISVSVINGDVAYDDVVDPDEAIDVLLPAVQADAVRAARELGGQMIDRS